MILIKKMMVKGVNMIVVFTVKTNKEEGFIKGRK